MTHPLSMLVIARDAGLIRDLDRSGPLAGDIALSAESGGLVRMNGRALQLAAGKDVIVVQADPHDAGEMAALSALARGRPADTPIIALTGAGASLADVRSLNDAGADRVLPMPDTADALAAELAQLGGAQRPRRLNLRTADTRRGRIIATVPARGGIGGTTLSVNLAERLAAPTGRGKSRQQARVALVDLDLQFGAVGSMLDLPEQDAIARLAGEGTLPDDTLLRQAMVDHPSGLRVLPAPATFVPPDALRADQVAAILDHLRAEFDYVVVDLPHAVAAWVEPVVARADALLLVTDISVPSIRQARRLIDLLTADHLNLPIQVIASRERKPLFATSARREAERALDRKIRAWLPSDPKRARAAADQGRPLQAIGGALATAIAALARTLARDATAAQAAERRN